MTLSDLHACCNNNTTNQPVESGTLRKATSLAMLFSPNLSSWTSGLIIPAAATADACFLLIATLNSALAASRLVALVPRATTVCSTGIAPPATTLSACVKLMFPRASQAAWVVSAAVCDCAAWQWRLEAIFTSGTTSRVQALICTGCVAMFTAIQRM